MARLSNSPVQQVGFELERRKSYSFRLTLRDPDGVPINLSGCTLRFIMKMDVFDDDIFDANNVIVNAEALIASPETGEATFAFQASELDGDPGEYNYAIVLWTAGHYSVLLSKGTLLLQGNTESASIHRTYASNTAEAAMEVTLRGNDVIHITANTIPVDDMNNDIIGVGRPDDPSTLEYTTLSRVQAAKTGALFISLDGVGENRWAWRKRASGWVQVEGLPPEWGEIAGRPATFPPDAHTHTWAAIQNKPVSFFPAAHQHTWSDIYGKPGSYPPAAHTHNFSELAGIPSAFTPSAHTHSKSQIVDWPTSFPPDTHGHVWGEITGKPSAFTPAAHSHNWNDITGKPTGYEPVSHSHAIGDLHDATAFGRLHLKEIDAAAGRALLELPAPSSISLVGHTHAWPDVTGKPSAFPPAAHTHAWPDVTGKPAVIAAGADATAARAAIGGTVAGGQVFTASDMAAIRTLIGIENSWSREYWGPHRPDILARFGSTPEEVAAKAWINAATSGATYTSTDGPQGAWVWRKRGTTWVCVEGDTGEISLLPALRSGWTATALTLRRAGHLVTITADALNATAATSDTLATNIPSGLGSNMGRFVLAQADAAATPRRLLLNPTAFTTLAGRATYTGPVYGSATLPCSDTAVWPTTLTIPPAV